MMPPVQRHSWVGSLKYPHGHPCRHQLTLSMKHEGRLRAISGSVRVRRPRNVNCRKVRPAGVCTRLLTPPVNHLVPVRFRFRSRW